MESELRKQIELLHRKFQLEAPEKVEQIIEKYDELNATSAWKGEEIDSLIRLLHKLAGSAGTLGLSKLGSSADKALNICKKLHEQESPDFNDWVEVGAEINAMSGLFQHVDEVNSLDDVKQIKTGSGQKLVYVVDDEPNIVELIQTSLENEGFRVEVFTDTESFKQACFSEWPDIALIDMDFPNDRFGGGQALAEIRQITDQKLLSIMISKHDDMKSRLMAFRAGATKYVLKPVNVEKIVNLTQELCCINVEEPYRVVIVDDVDYTRNTYSLTLESVGMEVRSLSNPLEVLDTVRDFKPDVLVLDVYMPEATGPEVAAVVRQDDALAWLSIMFLSVENDPVKQMSALEHGGDDFITKPVKPSLFVSSVKAKAWRARRNRRLVTTIANSP